MKGKICTNNEFTSMTDIDNVDVSIEGKYGRLVIKCYRDKANVDRFDIVIEPKKDIEVESSNEIRLGKEYMFICRGMLDFKNIVEMVAGT